MADALQRPPASLDTDAEATWSRRALFGALAGTGLGAALLAACGDGAAGGETGGEAGSNDEVPAPGSFGQYSLVKRFGPGILAAGAVRLPFQLSRGVAEIVSDGPSTLGAQVADIDGNPLGSRITAQRRSVDPFPYYDFRFQLDEPGVYTIFVDGGPEEGASFQLMPDDQSTVVAVGAPLPPFDTPTFDDARGLQQVCTRTPEACPFHDITLTEALALGRPVAYYVGTPQFCATGSCGPALEAIMDAADAIGDEITIIHAEVFLDDTATRVAPAVPAVGMTYEPALFITDASGVVTERLDFVWGRAEVDEAFQRALAG